MQLLDGKAASAAILQSLTTQTQQLKLARKRVPHLAAILVGNNPASETYVTAKVKTCNTIGFTSSLFQLEENISENKLINLITELNQKPDVDGILVQLPLPKHIQQQKIIDHIAEQKDVDGFHPTNIGKMIQGSPTFISATPYGIILLLEHYKIETKGKHAVVIGRSNIVGRPVSILLSSDHTYGNCTVTICHQYSTQTKTLCSQADIVVTAVGKTGLVTTDMIKEGAVVIDVGIVRIPDKNKKNGYILKGDVDFDNVAPKTSYITPVPGGVGPMTIAALMMNTWKAYQQRIVEDVR